MCTGRNRRELVGIPKLTYIRNLTTAILDKDVDTAVSEINLIIDEGKDLDNFLWEIIKYIKDVLVYKSTKKLELYSSEELENIENLANCADKEQLLKLIYDLSELANQMKWSTQKNIVFEAGIIKECIEVRSDNLEVSNSKKPEKRELKPIEEKKSKITKNSKEVKEETKELPRNSVKPTDKGVSYWDKVLDKIKQNGKIMVYTNLIGTRAIELDEMTIGIEFPNKVSEFAKKVLNEYENKALIEKLVSVETGNTMKVKYLSGNSASEANPKNNIENFANKLDIPINIIDE